MKTDEEFDALTQSHRKALCASFAQTWGEVFDSPLAAAIWNGKCRNWPCQLAEGHNGPCKTSERS